MSMRVIFMGTPDFAVPCLEKLIQKQYEVAAVVTQPDRPKGRGKKLAFSPVKECALAHDLPVLQPEKVKEPGFLQTLAQYQPDVIVVVAFGQFLPPSMLELPPCGAINVHASLLPHYRGAAPIHWAIMNGETSTGVTTMYMDRGMDTGDMILKKETAIGPDETVGELHDRLAVLGAELLAETMERIQAGTAPRIPQQTGQATYAPLLTRELERVDWTESAVRLHNRIRGLNPWPGAYCQFHDQPLKLWRTRVGTSSASGIPGQAVSVSGEGILVQTGAGQLELLEVQPASRRRIAAKEFISGYGIHEGDIFQ